MEKFQNKYRIGSARAQWWDYGWNGAYFITICTADREHYFGEIKNGKMILSQTGVIADILWHEIPHHSAFVELGDFVVMPNHIHGILILNKPGDTIANTNTNPNPNDVETGHALFLQTNHPPTPKTIGQQRFQNIGKNSISAIIGSYKSAVTKHANRLGLKNGWQVRFHDHIIRDDADYQRISDYIINNPVNWEDDKFFN
jgi:putative transposase